MKLKKKLAVIAILAATGLFASTLGNIDKLVEDINKEQDENKKTILLNKLDAELDTIDKQYLPKAHQIVNAKLKQSKVSAK